MQPARHAAAPALTNAARAHASVLMVLTPGADGTPAGIARRDRPSRAARTPVCVVGPRRRTRTWARGGRRPRAEPPCRDPSPRAGRAGVRSSSMDRRAFLGCLIGLIAAPLAAEAQPRASTPRIAMLGVTAMDPLLNEA